MSLLPPVDRPLDQSEAEAAFGAMLDGAPSDEEIAGFLVAMSDRGETAAEIAGAARAMRARMIPVAAPANAIDVCGTGGDGHHTLNVSTAVALVVAAAGVPVAKHGNRAASSKAGAADTLEALGLDLDRAMQTAEETLAELGIGFLFAGKHHPAMGRIMPIRRALGRRTIFNLMGPLANPARVKRQLVGIARPAYVPIYADALARLGTEHAFVVSGDEGLDELSLAGGNELAEITGGEVRMKRADAAEAGLAHAPIEAIRGGDPAHNAAELRKLLQGERGPYRDAVLFNAAAALLVAACGVPVAKHGNRAASSKAGAADTLEALGLDLDRAMETAEETLADLGICFLFAGKHHPAMGRIMPIRRAIGRRTIFNLMGPLANPARVKRQLVGIARPAYVPIYAEALARLGTEHAFVVSGDEGLDELSLAGGNEVAEIEGGAVRMKRVFPEEASLSTANVEAIRGGDPQHNAAALRRLLQGEHGAYRDAVLFNAAGALLVAGEVESWTEGAEEAAEAIDKGLANALLDCWIATTR